MNINQPLIHRSKPSIHHLIGQSKCKPRTSMATVLLLLAVLTVSWCAPTATSPQRALQTVAMLCSQSQKLQRARAGCIVGDFCIPKADGFSRLPQLRQMTTDWPWWLLLDLSFVKFWVFKPCCLYAVELSGPRYFSLLLAGLPGVIEAHPCCLI